VRGAIHVGLSVAGLCEAGDDPDRAHRARLQILRASTYGPEKKLNVATSASAEKLGLSVSRT
jgi:hypothetical protein